jgi:uncharacterized protein involved in exopolysaccharide biosynthesis
MTVNSTDALDATMSRAPGGDMIELDFRRYLETLISWWRVIALFTLGAVILGVAYILYLRATTLPVYQTSVDIIRERVVSTVNMLDTFRTTDSSADPNSSARREALVNLVQSSTVAEAVIAELGSLLSKTEREPAMLLAMVKAEAPVGPDGRTVSDLIRITVSANDPEKAAAIANSWAKHYVAHINSVYNQVPAETVASVEADMQRAVGELGEAQQALDTFIAASRVGELQHQIDLKTTLLKNYQSVQTHVITYTVGLDREVRAKLFDELVWAQTEAVYRVFNSQVTDRLNNLTQLYTARDLAQRQLAQAQNLRRQLEESGNAQSAGTALALQLLTTQVFATVDGSSLPGQLIVDLSSQLTDEDADSLADATTLVETLEQFIAQLDGEIDTLAAALLAGEGYAYIDQYAADNLIITSSLISQTAGSQTATTSAGATNALAAAIYERYLDLFDVGEMARLGTMTSDTEESTRVAAYIADLNREIQALQAELSSEKARETMLTQQHKLAWQTYDTLSNKVVELRLARAAANTEVRLGNYAITPTKPTEAASLSLAMIMAGLVGFVLSIVFVTVAHILNWHPWLSRSQPV